MKVLIRNPDVAWRVEEKNLVQVVEGMKKGEAPGDEPCVTLVKAGVLCQLNYIGSQIWEMADGTRGEAEIALEIGRIFEASEDSISNDVREFIGDLTSESWALWAEK